MAKKKQNDGRYFPFDDPNYVLGFVRITKLAIANPSCPATRQLLDECYAALYAMADSWVVMTPLAAHIETVAGETLMKSMTMPGVPELVTYLNGKFSVMSNPIWVKHHEAIHEILMEHDSEDRKWLPSDQKNSNLSPSLWITMSHIPGADIGDNPFRHIRLKSIVSYAIELAAEDPNAYETVCRWALTDRDMDRLLTKGLNCRLALDSLSRWHGRPGYEKHLSESLGKGFQKLQRRALRGLPAAAENASEFIRAIYQGRQTADELETNIGLERLIRILMPKTLKDDVSLAALTPLCYLANQLESRTSDLTRLRIYENIGVTMLRKNHRPKPDNCEFALKVISSTCSKEARIGALFYLIKAERMSSQKACEYIAENDLKRYARSVFEPHQVGATEAKRDEWLIRLGLLGKDKESRKTKLKTLSRVFSL
ncbi:hypothetical protein ACYPKM_05345 [Pseudomonas aeruginosa]